MAVHNCFGEFFNDDIGRIVRSHGGRLEWEFILQSTATEKKATYVLYLGNLTEEEVSQLQIKCFLLFREEFKTKSRNFRLSIGRDCLTFEDLQEEVHDKTNA